MALTRQSANILWSGSSTLALAVATRTDSDVVTFDATDVQAAVYIKVDNQDTPSSGDYVDIWAKFSPDGTNFDTDEHATYLGRWDTWSTNNPGEDPATKTVDISCASKSFKLSVSGPAAATHDFVITAVLHTQRSA